MCNVSRLTEKLITHRENKFKHTGNIFNVNNIQISVYRNRWLKYEKTETVNYPSVKTLSATVMNIHNNMVNTERCNYVYGSLSESVHQSS